MESTKAEFFGNDKSLAGRMLTSKGTNRCWFGRSPAISEATRAVGRPRPKAVVQLGRLRPNAGKQQDHKAVGPVEAEYCPAARAV